MASTVRVGVAGMIHDHVWQMVRQWRGLEIDPAAAADPNEPLRQRIEGSCRPRVGPRWDLWTVRLQGSLFELHVVGDFHEVGRLERDSRIGIPTGA